MTSQLVAPQSNYQPFLLQFLYITLFSFLFWSPVVFGDDPQISCAGTRDYSALLNEAEHGGLKIKMDY
jgi:hypothetical protein